MSCGSCNESESSAKNIEQRVSFGAAFHPRLPEIFSQTYLKMASSNSLVPAAPSGAGQTVASPSQPEDQVAPAAPPSPALPMEVIGMIAKFLWNYPKTVLELCLISKEAYHAAIPALLISATAWQSDEKGLSSLLRDSQGVRKTTFVRHLRLGAKVDSWLASSLLQMCESLQSLEVVNGNIRKPLFFNSIALAPFSLQLRLLHIRVDDDCSINPNLSALTFSALRDLKIAARADVTQNIIVALDRGRSLINITKLKLFRIFKAPSGAPDRSLQMGPSPLLHNANFQDLINHELNGFFIHPHTFLALSNGFFGRKIERLSLITCAPEDSEPNPFLEESLPATLRFDLPRLKVLVWRGPFHSTIADAFSDPKNCASLVEVSCQFVDGDLGPVPLDDYVFQRHLVSAISCWHVHQRTDETRAPWRVFYNLSLRKEFRPTTLCDHCTPQELALTPSTPWARICMMTSLRWLHDLKLMTHDLLMCGVPPNVKSMSLGLFMSGLKVADVDHVVKTLSKVKKGDIEIVDDKDPQFEEEAGRWEELIEEDALGGRLSWFGK